MIEQPVAARERPLPSESKCNHQGPLMAGTGAPLNPPDKDTFYKQGAKGYIDYPFLSDAAT